MSAASLLLSKRKRLLTNVTEYVIQLQEECVCTLFSVVFNNDVDSLQAILDQMPSGSVDFEEYDRFGFTPLHYAAVSGNMLMFDILSPYYSDLTIVTRDGTTILHCAALSGNVEFVKALLEKEQIKQLIRTKNDCRETPIHFAAESGDIDLIELLLEHGESLMDTTSRGHNVLHIAVKYGYRTLVTHLQKKEKTLLDHENPHPDHHGNSLLHLAALSGNLDLVRDIDSYTERNALRISRNTQNCLPIFQACASGNVSVVQYFVEKDASLLSEKSVNGVSLLHYAVKAGSLDTYRYLMHMNAQPNENDNFGKNIAHYATESGNKELLQEVLTNHPSLAQEKTIDNLTVLHFAATVDVMIHTAPRNQQQQEDSAKLNTINQEENVNVKENENVNVNDVASSVPDAPSEEENCLIAFLLENPLLLPNADTLLAQTTRKENESVLHMACAHGNINAVKYLVEKKNMDISIPTESGYTPLMLAAKNKYLHIVRYLLKQLENTSNVKEYYLATSHDEFRRNVLHFLAEFCYDLVIFTTLSRHDVDCIDRKDGKGCSPLHISILENNPRGFHVLQQCNAKVDLIGNGVTALHMAAFSGSVPIVCSLIETSQENYLRVEKYHPLNISSVRFPVNEPNLGDRSTALAYAVGRMNERVVHVLINAGASVTYTNDHGCTILHDACQYANTKDPHNYDSVQMRVIKLLLDKGAYKSIKKKLKTENQETPYEVSSNSIVRQLLAAYDPSIYATRDLVDVKLLEPYFATMPIGAGAYGDVYEGYLNGTKVAIKKMKADKAIGEYDFRLEVGIMGNVRHPNVCLFMGACLDKNSPCIVMEFIPDTLKSITTDYPLDTKDVVKYALDIAQGMACLHSRTPEILHRDLKLDNILIDNGRAKVADFGLSTISLKCGNQLSNAKQFYSRITPPEIEVGNQQYTKKSDIFSFGVCLFDMLARPRAFHTGLRNETASSGISYSVLLDELAHRSKLLAICQKCLEYNRELRYDSFDQIVNILREILQSSDELEDAEDARNALLSQLINPDQNEDDADSNEQTNISGTYEDAYM